MDDAVAGRRGTVVAVSPIVPGTALNGPADRMLAELGHEPSVVGVARLYAPICGCLVIDRSDEGHAGAVEREGLRCVVADTIMSSSDIADELARTTLAAVRR
jgi:LPPG:FO 2-phospho-L-lactate transferase